MHALDGPGQFEMRSRSSHVAVGASEPRDHYDFRRAHLKHEQQHAHNEEQQYSDGNNEWIPFHG